MKYVIIPQTDLDTLEKGRKEYYQKLSQDNVFEYMKTADLTGHIWYITHRRYKKLSLWNLIKTKWSKK